MRSSLWAAFYFALPRMIFGVHPQDLPAIQSHFPLVLARGVLAGAIGSTVYILYCLLKTRFASRTLAVVAVAFIATIAYGVWTLHHAATVVVPNCYAVEWVAGMVIDYMETHDGDWPGEWDDLRESYENVAKKVSHPRPPDYPWTFDELRSRVDVDWTAQPRSLATVLAKPGEPPFRVIWLRDGRQDHWSDLEPNRMILDYLKTLPRGRT